MPRVSTPVLPLACLVLLGLAPRADAQVASEALRARIEQVHAGQLQAIGGARLWQPDAVAHFFETRGFATAWSETQIDAALRAIRDVHLDGLRPADYHLAAIEALRAATASPARDAELQVVVSDALAALVDHVQFGRVRPVTLDRRWNVDPRQGAPPLEERLAALAAAGSLTAAIDSHRPAHFIYRGLRDALAGLRARAADGGWTAVPAGPALKPGTTDPRVLHVRRRLSASGDLPSPEGSDSYDEALEGAVRTFQERHRLTPDGIIGQATLDAMNVAVEARIGQLRVSLERARWVLGGLADSFVLVNLPAYKVYLIRDGRKVWETRAQVGRAGRQTPTFRADMRYLVFNPDWTVPPTILAQDVLAPMRKGQNTIARKGLTIIDRQGRRVSPDAIDWSTATPRNFPYTLRQPPGPNNALGRVKFVFPNEHTIFLHDTPSRELFSADQRTFSSGCIRIEQPLELASILLSDQGWTPDRIDDAVRSGTTETVLLDRPIPVLIVYWTVSVGASGELRYARDVYNLDGAVLRALGGA
jgi:L,D-transpeptidase YcbB